MFLNFRSYCNMTVRNFSFRFLKNVHNFAKFPSSFYLSILIKYLWIWNFPFLPKVLYISDVRTFANFRSFEHWRKFSYFRKYSEYFKISPFIGLWKISIFIKSFFNSYVRYSPKLETFFKIFKLSKYYNFDYFSNQFVWDFRAYFKWNGWLCTVLIIWGSVLYKYALLALICKKT
jgi:hypothetical protein